MATVIERLGRSLRTTFIGADPAPAWPPTRRWWLPPLGVLALVGFMAITMRYLQDNRGLSAEMAAGLGVLTVLPVALLWHRPLWAWRVTLVGLLVGEFGHNPLDTWPWSPTQALIAIIVMFVVALREPPGVVAWVGLSAIVTAWAMAGSENIIGLAIMTAVLLVLGEEIGRRRRFQREAEVQSERGEIAEARQAVLIERTRIARELHDVVAHSMSLVAVRAETAPYRLPGLPEPVREEFLTLAGTARDTLAEMRRLLGVLRTDQGPDLIPQPKLSDVDELIASMRQAGMQVQTTISRVPVSDATGLTVYRVVQEALSNAARHAPGAQVEVTVDTAKTETRVQVRNEPGATSAPAHGDGHGLTGMRERVELLGGTLHTGRTASGGFEVVAVIPAGPA